jgi:hypothetical protein
MRLYQATLPTSTVLAWFEDLSAALLWASSLPDGVVSLMVFRPDAGGWLPVHWVSWWKPALSCGAAG